MRWTALVFRNGLNDENETPTTGGPVTLKATSSKLTEKCEVQLIHEIVPDAASSKSAETICDKLYVFLDTEASQICEKKGEILQIAAMTNRWIKMRFNQYIYSPKIKYIDMHRISMAWEKLKVPYNWEENLYPV